MPNQTYSVQFSLTPEPFQGVNVNFCKNPNCLNYGRPASPAPSRLGRPSASTARERTEPANLQPVEDQPVVLPPLLTDSQVENIASRALPEVADRQTGYTPRSAGSGSPYILCQRCRRGFPIKSNLGIYEEYMRLVSYLQERVTSCPDEACANHGIDVKAGKRFYRKFGTTESGSTRYLCKACNKTFSVGKSTLRQRKPHVNILVFKLLMNKSPLRRICEVADIGPGTLYAKIEFIYQQCMKFVAHREQKLLNGTIRPGKLYISVDRQEYTVNWSNTNDKRNVILSSVGSADNVTSYVFGMNLNYDPESSPRDIENRAYRCGDYNASPPFRRYSRFWLSRDYAREASRSANAGRRPRGYLCDSVRDAYQVESSRDNPECSDAMSADTQTPKTGMQVHAEYTLYGNFLFLKKLLQHAEKVRFFLDQDSGMRNACLTAFWDEILERRCDAFFVSVNKEMTIHQKQRALADAHRELNRLSELYPYEGIDLKLELIKDRMRSMVTIGNQNDKWLIHPIPSKSEPEKMVCYLTDLGDYDENHKARLYDKATLHGVDRFFMQVRRRMSLFERPILTSSRARRTWFGYSPYNPVYVHKLLNVFRVFYNYVEVGEDRQTPAMRLGLARGPIKIEDILYYKA